MAMGVELFGGRIKLNKQAEYWYNESLDNLETAKVLYKNNKYLESLFFCQLSIEKVLKAIYVIRKGATPPKIHNLLLLAEKSDLLDELDETQLDFLGKVNSYQLEGRYPIDRELLYHNTSIDNFYIVLQQTEVELQWFAQRMKFDKL